MSCITLIVRGIFDYPDQGCDCCVWLWLKHWWLDFAAYRDVSGKCDDDGALIVLVMATSGEK